MIMILTSDDTHDIPWKSCKYLNLAWDDYSYLRRHLVGDIPEPAYRVSSCSNRLYTEYTVATTLFVGRTSTAVAWLPYAVAGRQENLCTVVPVVMRLPCTFPGIAGASKEKSREAEHLGTCRELASGYP